MHIGNPAETGTADQGAAPPTSGAGSGFMLGLFGYLTALVAFGYVGIFAGGADPGDQLAAGLVVAYLVALVASITVLMAARRLRRRHRQKAAAGLLGGMSVGILLLVLLSVRVVPLLNELASTCPCEPLIDQLRFEGG